MKIVSERDDISSSVGAGHHQPSRSFGVNVIGNVSSSTGLGVVARNMTKLFLQRGFPVSVLDLDPGLGRAGHDGAFDNCRVNAPNELPNNINFFVLQPPALFSLAASFPDAFVTTANLNVGLMMWELAAFPRPWFPALKVLDVIGAASDFIRSAFSSKSEDTPTISVPCPLYLPNQISPSRARFGLPEEAALFLVSFEPNSDVRRKNPFAAIEAFRQAFHNDSRRHLVIKLNNTTAKGGKHRAVTELHDICDAHENIHIVDRTLGYPDVLSLYATCDVVVSLHRAEGLGLGLMEAMALGKPVIATAWSGNMTFMDHTNSCLVGFDLVPVDGSLSVYRKEYLGKEATWANPRIEDAAMWMKRLADDAGLRASIGAKARTQMARYHELATEGHFVDELQAIWEQRAFLPPRKERHRLEIRRLWEAANTHPTSGAERLKRELRRVVEQHVTWRLKPQSRS